ncbi:DnaD domain protein [Shouchella patagoniensis]|uniref:DnaD domain protein n=1 Tax=Shouchella patagoniensis TaxID=228576 RepID=UPI000994C1A8|nr:DnaD domain protein [Shouchella patagoniensis]
MSSKVLLVDQYIQFGFGKQQNLFTPSAVTLFEALFFQACLQNSLSFKWSNRQVEAKTGLTRDTMFRARKLLVDNGFLCVQTIPGNPMVIYTFPYVDRQKESDDGLVAANGEESAEAISVGELKEDHEENVIVPYAEEMHYPVDKSHVKESGQSMDSLAMDSEYFDEGDDCLAYAGEKRVWFKDFKSTEVFKDLKSLKKKKITAAAINARMRTYFRQAGFPVVNKRILDEAVSWIENDTFQEGIEMIEQAIDLASDAGVPKWSYVRATLNAWKEKGFQTVEDTVIERQVWSEMKQKQNSGNGEIEKQIKQKQAYAKLVKEYPDKTF